MESTENKSKVLLIQPNAVHRTALYYWAFQQFFWTSKLIRVQTCTQFCTCAHVGDVTRTISWRKFVLLMASLRLLLNESKGRRKWIRWFLCRYVREKKIKIMKQNPLKGIKSFCFLFFYWGKSKRKLNIWKIMANWGKKKK